MRARVRVTDCVTADRIGLRFMERWQSLAECSRLESGRGLKTSEGPNPSRSANLDDDGDSGSRSDTVDGRKATGVV